jgi:hypothetical protein
MTLAIYLPCKDVHLLVTDRLEVGDDATNYETDKMFFAETKDFAMVGSGRSELIDRVYAEIRSNKEVTSENIHKKMDEAFETLSAGWDSLLTNLPEYERDEASAKFIIVARQNGKVNAFYAPFSKTGKVYPISNSIVFSIGVGEKATAILTHSKSYRTLSILDAIPFAVALTEEIASTHSFIGRLEEYGFSIVAFTDDNKVFFTRAFKKKIACLEIQVKSLFALDLSDFETSNLGAT